MNFESFINGKIYEVFNFLFKMMLINVIWVVTLFLGLGLFSFMPATVALFLLVKSVIKNEEVPIFKTFFKIFFKEYFKSQKIFLVLLLGGILLYFNYLFYISSNDTISQIGIVISFLVFFIYILIFNNIFLVYIHYPHVKVFRTFKLTFLISMLYAIKTILVIIINVVVVYIFFSINFLFAMAPLILMSLIAYITLSLLNNNYMKLVKDQPILSVKNYQ